MGPAIESYSMDLHSDLEELLTDRGPELICIHSPGGVVHFIGPAISELTGVHADEMVGRSFLELVHPDDRSGIKNGIVRASVRGTTFGPHDHRMAHRSGKWKWVQTQTLPIKDIEGNVVELQSTLRDITARKMLRDRLVMHDTLMRETNALARVGGWRVELPSRQLYWSEEVRRIHEVPPAFVPTVENAISFYTPDSRPIITRALEDTIADAQMRIVELPLLTYTGRRIWVRAIIKADKVNGRVERVYGAFQDITERKQREQELKALVDHLTTQNLQLEEFSQIVSHNLRAPVSNILTLVSMLEHQSHEEDREILMEHMRKAVEQLDATLTDLTTAVAIRNDSVLHQEDVHFADVLERIMSSLSAEIHEAGAVVMSSFDVTSIVYPRVYLESIMLHLLTNALRYASPARRPLIEVRSMKQGNDVILEVVDNGTGIDLARFGDKIFRLRTSFHRDREGRGTGLFLTRNIVESMGGEITVESTVDVGSRFRINFTKHRGRTS